MISIIVLFFLPHSISCLTSSPFPSLVLKKNPRAICITTTYRKTWFHEINGIRYFQWHALSLCTFILLKWFDWFGNGGGRWVRQWSLWSSCNPSLLPARPISWTISACSSSICSNCFLLFSAFSYNYTVTLSSPQVKKCKQKKWKHMTLLFSDHCEKKW